MKNFEFQRVEILLKVFLINVQYIENLKDLVMIIQKLDRFPDAEADLGLLQHPRWSAL